MLSFNTVRLASTEKQGTNCVAKPKPPVIDPLPPIVPPVVDPVPPVVPPVIDPVPPVVPPVPCQDLSDAVVAPACPAHAQFLFAYTDKTCACFDSIEKGRPGTLCREFFTCYDIDIY